MQRSDHDHEMTTGHPAVNIASRILSHLSSVLAAVLAILFLIDRVKRGEMSFLCNDLTKWMLLALCVMTIANSVLHLNSLSKLRAIRRYFALAARKREKAK